jgi:hypothetical protein
MIPLTAFCTLPGFSPSMPAALFSRSLGRRLLIESIRLNDIKYHFRLENAILSRDEETGCRCFYVL